MISPRLSVLALTMAVMPASGTLPALAADLMPPLPAVDEQVLDMAAAPRLRGDAQVSGGAYAVDNGYSDRAFVALQGSLYEDGGFGVHVDASHVQREEDAAFFAAGMAALSRHSHQFFLSDGHNNTCLRDCLRWDSLRPRFQGGRQLQWHHRIQSMWRCYPATALAAK